MEAGRKTKQASSRSSARTICNGGILFFVGRSWLVRVAIHALPSTALPLAFTVLVPPLGKLPIATFERLISDPENHRWVLFRDLYANKFAMSRSE